MAGKYWWEEDDQKKQQSSGQTSSQETTSQGYWWESDSLATTVGNNITNRVNAWLKNHNNYISNYQNRYSGRKYNYDDAYVSDSASWLDTVSKQKSKFDEEADSIISYMDQYKDYLNEDWMKSVREKLTGARGAQSQILDSATKDNEWWSGFGNEELVKKYGSAEDAYKYYQRSDGYRKKYEGMTHEEIQNILSNLEKGEESDWLSDYQWLRYSDADDFDEYAAKGAAIENPSFYDAQGSAIGPWRFGNEEVGNIVTFSRDNYSDLGSYTEGGRYDAVGSLFYHHMKDEEVKMYNYLLAKEGKEKAAEYLEYLDPYLKARYGGEIADIVTGIDIPILEDLAIMTYGAVAGVDSAIQNTAQFFTSEERPTSVTQYANQSISEDLHGIGSYAHQAATTVGNMAPSILLSTLTGNPLVGRISMGVSAAGGAYGEALRSGMSKTQARTYSTLVGVSETMLQEVFDGISALGGGKGISSILASKIAAIDSGLLRGAARMGVSIGSEIIEEEAQLWLEPLFKTIITGDEYDAPKIMDMVETAIVTMMSTGVLESSNTVSLTKAEQALKAKYGDKTDAIIKEGLESDVESESYKLATKYQQQVAGKDGKAGKALTGAQIRDLLAANQEQITPKDLKKIQQAAEKRLTDLGQTDDVAKVAELATKRATGQKLTKDEKTFLANSKYGARVANELLPENIISGDYTTDWAEGIGTQKVNAGVYNIKNILAEMANMNNPATYKSLEERVSKDDKFSVSESGKAKISKTGDAINLSKPEIVEFVRDKETGKVTDMVLNVDGKKVKASEIDFADGDQSYLFSAVKNIENITPGDAQAIIRDYDPTSGQTVGEYLNGIDEAYTYGYHRYSEADMGAGLFTPKLSSEQAKGAYLLGQTTRNKSDTNKSEAIKRMRTAVEAETEKAAADGKEAPKAKQMTITYNEGGGKIKNFDDAGIELTGKQGAGVEVAKILHKLGLGTNFEFFATHESDTLTVKDRNTGEVKKARVFINDAGVEQIAYSGVYRKSDGTIRIDLNAYNGRELTLNALAHELTHFIQQWSDEKYKVLVDFLMKTYEKTDMTMHQRVLRHQKFLKDVRGEDVSYNEAYDEVVANAMMKMFDDGKLVERLTELKAVDKNLAQKLWERFKQILSEFLGFYEKEDALFYDTDDLMKMKEAFEQLQNMFAEALVEASENFQASLTPGVEGTVFTQTGEAVAHCTEDGSVQLSLQTYETEGRNVFRDYLKKCVSSNKLTKAEMTEMMDGIEEIYQTCKKFKDKYAPFSAWSDAAVVRDTHGRPVFSVVTPNGDYKMNLDFSLVCKKRRTLDAVFNEMSKRGIIDDFELGQKSVVKINEIIRKYGLETACALCFVDAKRFRQASMADSFTRLYNELVESLVPEDQKSSIDHFNFSGYETIKKVENGIDTWDNSKLDFSHINHVLKTYGSGTVEYKTAKYIKTHAEGRKLLLRGDFMSSKGFDAVKSQNPDVLKLYNSKKGTGGPKAAFGDVQYMNEIIQKARWWTPEKAYSVGGVRVQSFSDYVPRMVFDYVQMIYDLAATKLPAHAYTKEALFVKQFGLTGIKINMSLIPAIAEGGIAPGLDANGNYVWAGESFDYETAKEIQNAEGYTENCGTICVGVSYDHIVKLLRDPNIRMVIPYHKSGLNPIVAHMNKIAEFHDYTNDQRTKGKDGKALEKDFDFSKALHDMGENANPKAVADKYLKWCAAHGYTPRFAEFAMEDNYYKLLEDFTLYDKDGKYVPQRAVKAVFPTNDSAFGSMKSLIEAGLQEDAVIEGKRDKNLSAIVDEIQNTLPKTEAEIEETQVEQADRDLEQYSSQKTDLDTSGEVNYDNENVNLQEVNGNERREESREAFYRRAHEKKYTVRERGQIACGYTSVTNKTRSARQTERNLKKLGIQVIVHEGLEANVEGTTMVAKGDATSVAGDAVYVRNSMKTDPVETAGHEAFHFWKHTDARVAYKEIVAENIVFSSDAFVQFQKEIAEAYFGEEIDFKNDGTDKLIEEIFAYITGLIHAGDSKNIVRSFMRDYDAVKVAWDDLIKKQTEGGSDQFSSQETDADNAPTFYSQMCKVVESMKQEKFGASSVISMLRGRGVKAEEIRWSGIQAFLDGKKSVTKQELLDFINSSMLQIEEERREKSNAHYEFVREWQRLVEYMDEEEILDGLNYVDTSMQPHLEELVDAGDLEQEEADYLMELAHKAVSGKELPTKWDDYKLDGGDNYRELVFKMPGSDYSNGAMQAHWGSDAQGVLAHARLQDFNTFIGKMLFIEEIQSDWHNAGQKQGYFVEGEKVTTNNTEMRHENGWYNLYYDGKDLHQGVSETFLKQRFVNGITEEEIHEGLVDEYNRSVEHSGNGWKAPDAPFKSNYHEYVLKRLLRMAAEEGYDSIGWTTADIQSDRWSDEFAEGYRIEYDQDIPKFLKKYGKQWGSTVGKTTLDNGTEVWSMAITDAMKKSVLKEGQAMYSSQETDADYMDAVNRGDMETVQQMVDEAAKNAGYSEKAYHGTSSFGFTKFDPAMSDDKTTLFFTDDIKVASTYAGRDVYRVKNVADAKSFKYEKGKVYTEAEIRDAYDVVQSKYHVYGVIKVNEEKQTLSHAGQRYSAKQVFEMADSISKEGIYGVYLNTDNVLEVDAGYTGWMGLKNPDAVEWKYKINYRGDGDFNYFKAKADDMFQFELLKNGETAHNGTISFTQMKTMLREAIGSDRTEMAIRHATDGSGMGSSRFDTAYSDKNGNYAEPRMNTRELAQYAKKHGYRGVKVKNLKDWGGKNTPVTAGFAMNGKGAATVYILFDSNQVKSADPVTYDAKGNVIPLSKRFDKTNDDIRYSTQETDNISNRELLANAFEGLSQNSDEYKMIQEYKDHIKLLNEYEEKLSKLNAEIRKLTFGTEGERDSKKLKELQTEAKKVAENINRHDKKLLSMEVSEPLRKVVERERKKESQKTKDHVKELLQNKKARAEQTELRHKIRKAVRDLDKLLNRGNKKLNVKEDMKVFATKALDLADYLFTDHISNDELIRRGITVPMRGNEPQLVKETEDILSQLYDNADNLTDEEFTRLDAKRKSNLEKLRDLLTDQRNARLSTPVYQLFDDLVTEYAHLKNSKQDAVKAAYNEDLENSLRAFISDDDRVKILKNMRVADMTTEELNWLYRAYTMVLTNVRNANTLFVKGKQESIEQTVSAIVMDFTKRKAPEGKAAIVARNLANKIGWDYAKLYYALDRIGSEAFTELIMNIADSENTVMQDIMEAAAYRDKIVENYGFNNWDINKEIDKEFLDNTGKKFKLTLGQLMSLYAYSRRKGAWDHIEYGGFVFGEKALTNPRPADSYKLSQAQCEAITNTLTKEQKAYVEDMQKYLSETMGEKGNEVSMMLYGIKMFGEKNYFPIHVAGQYKAQANESQAKAAAGFQSMSNAGFTHAQNPNAKAPFVLEGFNEIWADHVNEMSRYHGTVPALEDLRRVMNRSTYSDSVAESSSVKAIMENAFGKEAVDYFDNLYREANSGAIQDKLQRVPKKLLSLFRKNSVAYSLSVVIQQPSAMARAYALIDKKYFGFKGFGALTSGVAKAVSSKWNPAYANAYNEMLKYAPGVTMAKEIGGFDTHTGTSIREYLLDTGKNLKQKWKTGTAMEKGMAALDLVDNNAIANLPNVADKIAWIEIWNACKRETVATHKDLAPNSEEFMQAVGERFTEVIRATQVYDSMFSKSPLLKSKSLAVQYLVSFMNEPNTTANMVEKAVRDATRGDWKSGVRTAAAVTYSIIFNNVLKAIVYAMRDDDEDETYIEKYLASVVGGIMGDFNPINYIPVARDAWSKAQGYDVERPDMAIISDAIDAYNAITKLKGKDTENMTEADIAELDKKMTDASWNLVGSLAAFFGIPVKNVYREIKGVIDHARIASANAGMTTASSLWDKVTDEILDSIPFVQTKNAKQDKLYDAIVSGDAEYVKRMKSTYKTDDAYHSAVRKALRENDPRIKEAAQARYDGNTDEYKRIFREIKNEGKFTFDDIMSAINTELSKLTPDKVTSDYTASGYVDALILGNTSNAKAMKDDIIATKVANGKTQDEAEKEFASNVATGIREAYTSGLLNEASAEKMLMEYADMDDEDSSSRVNYWAFCEDHPGYDLSESNVNDYIEFAEPASVPLDVFAQFVEGTKGLVTKKDEWGDVDVTKREQVLEFIDSLPLTWQQKDALYLAAGYSESKIWDVPW